MRETARNSRIFPFGDSLFLFNPQRLLPCIYYIAQSWILAFDIHYRATVLLSNIPKASES